MIRIEVKSATVTPRNITIKSGPKVGQQSTFHEQEAYAYTTDREGNLRPYPERIVLNIEVQDGQQPYAPGNYQPDPSCLYVDRFGSLTLGRMKLRPLAPAQVKAA